MASHRSGAVALVPSNHEHPYADHTPAQARPDRPTSEQHTHTAGDEPQRIYTPRPGEAQLTVRSVTVGCLIGGLLAAMNTYFGLSTGWWVPGSLIAAIVGVAVFSVVRPKRPYTALEANITQTVGSAAGSMTSAAGLLAAIPALGMMGRQFHYWELSLWALSVAFLGVFYAVPLRRQMILAERLRFPSGTATAETIVAMLGSGRRAVNRTRTLALCMVVSGSFTLIACFVPQVRNPPMEWFGAVAAALGAWGFSVMVSPMMLGAGVLVGPRVGFSVLAGAIIGWGVLGYGVVHRLGWMDGPVMSVTGGVRGWILWPGVALMVGEAITCLLLSWKAVVGTFRPLAMPNGLQCSADDNVPLRLWGLGLLLATAVTTCCAWAVFHIPPLLTLVAILLSWFLACIAVRASGETDVNPVGGISKITQLAFGGLAPGAVETNVMAAAISGSGASQAADLMHDLKTGHLLGACAARQVVAQLIGIVAGALFCVPVFLLFDRVYEIGGDELPAPAAHSWRAMADLLTRGLEALPPHAVAAVVAGLAVGVTLPLLARIPRLKPVVPSGLAMGIAMIIPASYSIAMCAGSVALLVWRWRSSQTAERLALAVASGLIAGEGLMGVVTAVLRWLGLGAVV